MAHVGKGKGHSQGKGVVKSEQSLYKLIVLCQYYFLAFDNPNMIMWDGTSRGNGEKHVWDLSALFLLLSSKSEIISKQKVKQIQWYDQNR